MTITIERSGGFAGLTTTAEVRTETLPAADAQRLEGLARALPDSGGGPPEGMDLYQYDVTVADADGSRTVRFYGEPNPATALIDEVFRLTGKG
jgi:hypothetical protein